MFNKWGGGGGSTPTPPAVDNPVNGGDQKTNDGNNQKESEAPSQQKPYKFVDKLIRTIPDYMKNGKLDLVDLLDYVMNIENLKELDSQGNETNNYISVSEMKSKYEEVLELVKKGVEKTRVEGIPFYSSRLVYYYENDGEIWKVIRKKYTEKTNDSYNKTFEKWFSSLRNSYWYPFRNFSNSRRKEWEKKDIEKRGLTVDSAEQMIKDVFHIIYAHYVSDAIKSYAEFKLALLEGSDGYSSFDSVFKNQSNVYDAANSFSRSFKDFMKLENQYARTDKEFFTGRGLDYFVRLLEISNNEVMHFAKVVGVSSYMYAWESCGYSGYDCGRSSQSIALRKIAADTFKETTYNGIKLEEIKGFENYSGRSIDGSEKQLITKNLINRYKTKFRWNF
ncbi:hypothetical protein [Mycoplasmopsis agassizii]|uniref:hypothetical protein n=1 Tax=Mycoplasmopsis agassizii TaxID=33922 RepID=UPI0009D80406|nr:hypothetical protein [Mycoplasmopsis agassizii]SMC19314.1 hypothetical protein SAMN02745179_00887 [Mycoplasmopsis agassizii]